MDLLKGWYQPARIQKEIRKTLVLLHNLIKVRVSLMNSLIKITKLNLRKCKILQKLKIYQLIINTIKIIQQNKVRFFLKILQLKQNKEVRFLLKILQALQIQVILFFLKRKSISGEIFLWWISLIMKIKEKIQYVWI